MPVLGWLKQLFLTVLEVEKSKTKVLEDLVSGESSLPDVQVAGFRLCLHTTEREIPPLSCLFPERAFISPVWAPSHNGLLPQRPHF